MGNFNKKYDRIVSIIELDNNYDPSKKRFISDLKDSFLFYYPETGKILEGKNNQLITIFRYKYVCWVSKQKLNDIIKQLEK